MKVGIGTILPNITSDSIDQYNNSTEFIIVSAVNQNTEPILIHQLQTQTTALVFIRLWLIDHSIV